MKGIVVSKTVFGQATVHLRARHGKGDLVGDVRQRGDHWIAVGVGGEALDERFVSRAAAVKALVAWMTVSREDLDAMVEAALKEQS